MHSAVESSHEPVGFSKCPHVEHAEKLTHCEHCDCNFCDRCASVHKELVLLDIIKASTRLPPEKASADLLLRMKHAAQFLDEDLLLIKQQIGSTIDSIVERFSTYLWSQGSKILGEAEEAVTSEKDNLKAALENLDLQKFDSDTEELKERLRKYQGKKLCDLSLGQLAKLARDISCQAHLAEDVERLLNINKRVRVGFDMNTELEKAVQSFDALKLGAVNVSQPRLSSPPPRRSSESSTDASYRKVTLLSVFHGNDAFGDPLYLPHGICALPNRPFVAVLHGEYRISILSCNTVGPSFVVTTYHVHHPTNAPASLPLHNIAADTDRLFMVGEPGATSIVSFPIEETFESPDHRTIVPKVFAKSWSECGFRGLAVASNVRWLYTADGDTIAAYSLDNGVPTYRRIGTFPQDFEPTIFDVFPDGVTLVYASKSNSRKIYWRAFPIGENGRKNNSEIIKSSRHYENLREANFGGIAVDCSSNLILCDDRSLQVFYRYAVDMPVSTFPLPIARDDLAPSAHILDPCGMAVLPCGISCDGRPEDVFSFKESFSSICAVADCSAHRIIMFQISG